MKEQIENHILDLQREILLLEEQIDFNDSRSLPIHLLSKKLQQKREAISSLEKLLSTYEPKNDLDK